MSLIVLTDAFVAEGGCDLMYFGICDLRGEGKYFVDLFLVEFDELID